MINNTLEYKGYYGYVEYSAADEVFFGKLIGITDHITFEGDSIKSLRKDFEEAVEDYLESCKELGKEPEKTYKGTFNVRIKPETHRRLALFSILHNKSLNSTVEEAIEQLLTR